MAVYYNENDPQMAAWIRELMKENLIAPGDVDERSIEDVTPNELRKYTQCHFFAGIAIWSNALRNIGWPDDRPIWSGSCPCQPFSAAGQRKGTSDKRHLWPAWFHLIDELRPVAIVGEQVSSKDILPWFDLVSDDLEGAGYTVRALDIPACSVGAFHIRQRLYFLAHAANGGAKRESRNEDRTSEVRLRSELVDTGNGRESIDMADTLPTGRAEGWAESGNGPITGSRGLVELGNASSERLQGRRKQHSESERCVEVSGSPGSFWRDVEWIYCRDEKYRPTKPGIFPLVNGMPRRVGLLRGAGNAIVSPLAEAFIESWLDEIEQ
jgi:DNA (cytosine-5)-methyltransferase 1